MRTFDIAGTAVLIAPKWKITSKLSSRTTFSGTVTWPLDFTPQIDTVLTVANGENEIFKGIITAVVPNENGVTMEYDIAAVDYTVLADNRILSFVAYNKTAGDIITDYVLPTLAAEGISAGTIEDGATVVKAVFPFRTAAQVLNNLAEVSGDYYWIIDRDKQLHFRARTAQPGDLTVSSDIQHSKFKYKRDTGDYRNVQIIVGSSTVTTPQTETPSENTGDDAGTYTTRFGIALQPRIFVSSVEQTDIGVEGLDSAAEWTWAYNSKQIKHNGETHPGAITVIYTGLYNIMLRRQRTREVNRKKALMPDTSGRRESLYTDGNLNTPEMASQYAMALLDKYAQDAETVSFRTEVDGFVCGLLYRVVKPLYGIDGYFLCTEVKAAPISPDAIEYDVKLSGGNSVGGWEEYFRALVDRTKAVTIGENDVATVLKDAIETAEQTAASELTLYDVVYPADDLYPSDTQYPGDLNSEVTLND